MMATPIVFLKLKDKPCFDQDRWIARITPELKKAWSGGRRDHFYPYRKTYAQTLGEQD